MPGLMSRDGGPASGVEPAVLTPCPDGWSEVQGAEVTWCNPWPQTLATATCLPHTWPLPGDTECSAPVDQCQVGPWPDAVESGGSILFVDQNAASEGADGTRDKPYPSLRQAYQAAADGTVIAMSSGIYWAVEGELGEPLILDRPIGVSFVGLCPTSTFMRSPMDVRGSASVVLEGVHALQVAVSDSNLSVVSSVIEEMTVSSGSFELFESSVTSLDVAGGKGQLVASRVQQTLEMQAGELTITDSLLSEPQLPPGVLALCELPCGVMSPVNRLTGGQLEVSRSVVRRGLLVTGGVARLSEVSIGGDGTRVSGVGSEDDGGGLAVAGGQVELSDAATGTIMMTGGTLTLERVFVSNSGYAGIVLEQGSVRAGDVVFGPTGTFAQGVGDQPYHYGRAIDVRRGGTMTGARVHIYEARDVGVFAEGQGTVVDLTSVRVVNQQEQLCAELGTGCFWDAPAALMATSGARIAASEFDLVRSKLTGVLVGVGGTVNLEYGSVRDNPIGAVVHDSEFDPSNLQKDVAWINNEVNLDSAQLSPPQGLPELVCHDDIDNDGDGDADCDDSDCSAYLGC